MIHTYHIDQEILTLSFETVEADGNWCCVCEKRITMGNYLFCSICYYELKKALNNGTFNRTLNQLQDKHGTPPIMVIEKASLVTSLEKD